MNRFISILMHNWFSFGIIVILCLSFAKRTDVTTTAYLNTNSFATSKTVKPIQINQVNKTIAANQLASVTPPLPKAESITETNSFLAEKETIHQQFIQRFSKVAVAEMEQFGIPASITLAHALLESNGQLGKHNTRNNFFNIPCQSKTQQDHCVKQYKTAWFSFRDHSKYLTTGKYKYLTRIQATNHREWAKGIQSIGYPNQPDYDNQLLDIIEMYDLSALDRKNKKT